MRLFISIDFSEATVAALAQARDELRALTRGKGSFPPDTNLHLTLAFLGETPPERAADALDAMRAAAGRPFDVTFDRAGCFKRDGGDIWWAGGPDNPALIAVQRRLARELAERGFVLEARRFSPHVTLARRVIPGIERPALIKAPVSERVEALSLMRSELGHGAPRYTELSRVLLT